MIIMGSVRELKLKHPKNCFNHPDEISTSNRCPSSSLDPSNHKMKKHIHQTIMSTYNTKCDSCSCANSMLPRTSKCDNSYQKSKFRRKKRQSSLLVLPKTSAEDDSSKLGCEPTFLMKSSEYFHQSLFSFEENAQQLESTAQPTCMFGCSQELHKSSSISSDQVCSSRINCCATQVKEEQNTSYLPRKSDSTYNNTINCKSHVKHHSFIHSWHQFSFLLIKLIILSLFLDLRPVNSFGNHVGLTGGGFISRGGIFGKSDKSKMSVIPEKLIKPKTYSEIKTNLGKKDTASILGSNRMQADSPFNEIHNLQEIFRNFGTRDRSSAHRKENNIEIEKDRRHSHDRRNEEKSSKHYRVSQHKRDGSNKNTIGRGQWKKSLEEIKRGYSEIGCKFYQIWNPANQKYLQVDPENTSVGLTDNVSSFNSYFQLTYRHDGKQGATILENVQTCLSLCLSAEGQIYTSENGIEEPGCWFDTTMTSTVSEYLTLKSSMNSNTSHNLDIAITPKKEQKIKYRQKYIEGITKSYIPPLIVHGVWMKRGTEDESTQFQMFSVAFDDLRKSVAEDILPLIYRSYVRLQNYCPIVLRKRVKYSIVYPRKGVSQVPNDHKKSKKGINRSWNARNCDKVRSKTDRRICLRFQRKQCYIKLKKRLKHEDKFWSKRKIVFSCKKRQKRDRCVNYYLKDKSKQLKKILRRRYEKNTYSYRKHKRIARKICKKKVSKMRYKKS